MAAIERRTLKKAPPVDVVEAFTQSVAAPVREPDPAPASAETTTSGSRQSVPADQRSDAKPAAVRRGPGRPRSKRRMEPFSSKLDIELRDSIDAYLFENGGTLVDLLDEALRARIAR